MSRPGTVQQQQKDAWAYYGFPGSDNRPVGEVRYVEGWQSDQMTRLEWDVFIDGNEKWTVNLPGEAGTISTTDGSEEDQTAASMRLLELIGWNDTNITAVNTNLFVAGAGDYIEERDGTWRVVSVVESKRRETLKAAKTVVPILWPHPADPKKPDAPLFAVLPILDELDWLSRQGRTQSRQRALTSGFLFLADGFQGPNGTDLWEQFNLATSAKMLDPDDMSPIRFSGPLGDGQGPNLIQDGVNWIVPDYGYDAVLDRRVLAAITRLAWGLPVPPEILLGMQAQSRATAFQVEENSYRAHIEPAALRVAQVAEDALKQLLVTEGEDGSESAVKKVRVVPNPSKLLARKNSVEDVKWARTVGLVNDEYTREVLGIPQDAAGDGVPISAAPVEKDPANRAADEPVTAAARTGNLSDLLADIDAFLASELAGVTVMATDRARQRLGAAARSVESVRNNGAKNLSNPQLAVKLGLDGLTAAGVNVADVIAEPINSAADWWMKRVEQAWAQAGDLIPGWTGQGEWVENSITRLVEDLTEHIVSTLSEPSPSPLAADGIRRVVDAAAGGR